MFVKERQETDAGSNTRLVVSCDVVAKLTMPLLHNAFEELAPYCKTVHDSRIVDEGDVVTGRGVSSSIDLGLFLVERLAGKDARIKIAKQMDYPYHC